MSPDDLCLCMLGLFLPITVVGRYQNPSLQLPVPRCSAFGTGFFVTSNFRFRHRHSMPITRRLAVNSDSNLNKFVIVTLFLYALELWELVIHCSRHEHRGRSDHCSPLWHESVCLQSHNERVHNGLWQCGRGQPQGSHRSRQTERTDPQEVCNNADHQNPWNNERQQNVNCYLPCKLSSYLFRQLY